MEKRQKIEVTVIDYGIGNLRSVTQAIDSCGVEVCLTDSPDKISTASHLVLPGVGSFADGMDGLSKKGLIGPIKAFVAKNKPFLGICLGMQMMLEIGEEFGEHKGLGLLSGRVVSIPSIGKDGKLHKIPHIGWDSLIAPPQIDWQKSILGGIEQGEFFYFVHSFMANPSDEQNKWAICDYNGQLVTAVIRSGNLYGCQFHPEKSGKPGLQILRNFCEIQI